MYEQQVSHVAIDTGADLVLAEHAHILKGIEQYNGKTIFHGLGNFVSNFQAFPKDLMQDIRRAVKELYNIESDSDDPSKHYHPEAMHTIIAKCSIRDGRISKMGYVPCSFNEQNQPEILKHDERGQQVFDYVADISRKAGLNARFEWDGDEVVIH
jgi:poly-gamma-glutamate synthesis protein (capsule biosynthesis protein)